MLNILVTGANAQLGQEIESLSSTYTEFNFVFKTRAQLDITNYDHIENELQATDYKFLINCAAYTNVEMAEDNLALATSINTTASAHLSKLSAIYSCRLIHISNDYVFDGLYSVPYHEEDLTHPLSNYGKTKREGEFAILENAPNVYLLRTARLYSRYGKYFVKKMLELAHSKTSLQVVCDQVETPTYTKDLAQVILRLISGLLLQTLQDLPGIYHYSNEGVASWYDFAKAIMEEGDLKCEVQPVSASAYVTKTRRPNHYVLSKRKIKEQFNFQIPHWKDSLQMCIQQLKLAA